MNDMYQVRAYVEGSTIRSRQPIFMTFKAENSAEAKMKARREIFNRDPDVKIKKLTATPVF